MYSCNITKSHLVGSMGALCYNTSCKSTNCHWQFQCSTLLQCVNHYTCIITCVMMYIVAESEPVYLFHWGRQLQVVSSLQRYWLALYLKIITNINIQPPLLTCFNNYYPIHHYTSVVCGVCVQVEGREAYLFDSKCLYSQTVCTSIMCNYHNDQLSCCCGGQLFS